MTVTIKGGSLPGDDTVVTDHPADAMAFAHTAYSGLSTTKVVMLAIH